MSFIIELLVEFLVQFVGEVLVENGLRALAEPFQSKPSPWLAAGGYALLGLIVGLISVFIVKPQIVEPVWRAVNLLVTPVAVGLSMMAVGWWRAKRGQTLLRLDRFAYGYLFALSFAVVRYVWAA
jgi:hypothetical protein